ncbi:hypothetical protein JCM11641_006087 [Rhodosporidiobolus odoratus]
MKAWVFKRKGDPAVVLKIEQDWPKPNPSKGQVLVKVRAVSLNPVGWKAMGMPPISWMQKAPAIPESDISGVVEGGDLSGTGLEVGDAVFGIVPADSIMKSGQGVLAEYALVKKDLLTKKPENVSFEEACSFPLTTFTTQWSLEAAGLRKGSGQRVFINGGSGGVGVYAIQLAKAYGAYVVTTCSPPSRKLVESLGPDEVLDYKEKNIVDQLSERFPAKEKPFDIIYDTVGHEPQLFWQSAKYLSRTGTFVDIAGPPMEGGFGALLSATGDLFQRYLRPAWLGGVPTKYTFGFMVPSQENLREMAQFIAEGKLKPVLDEVFPFEQALRAYDRQKSGRSKGKVVISLVDA